MASSGRKRSGDCARPTGFRNEFAGVMNATEKGKAVMRFGGYTGKVVAAVAIAALAMTVDATRSDAALQDSGSIAGPAVAMLIVPGAAQQLAPAPGEMPQMQLAFSPSTTGSIVSQLDRGTAECGALPAEYRADCMSQAYRRAAGATQGRPDYGTAQSELNRTSRSLSNLVSQNADTEAAPIRKSGRTYRAVKKSAVRKVAQQAVAIITETETKLLRSSGSGQRKVHYQRIAQAVGSTKRIFRS